MLYLLRVGYGVHAFQAKAGDGAVACGVVRHADLDVGQIANSVDPAIAQGPKMLLADFAAGGVIEVDCSWNGKDRRKVRDA